MERNDDRLESVIFSLSEGPAPGDQGEGGNQCHQYPEAFRVLRQGHPTHIHAKKAGNDVDRQRQHRHHREGKQCAVALFIEVGGDLFLQQFDAFAQGGQVVDDQRKFLGGFA